MKIFFLVLFPLFLFSNMQQGYIDTHGGKKDKLFQKRSDFSSNLSPFGATKIPKEANTQEKAPSKKQSLDKKKINLK